MKVIRKNILDKITDELRIDRENFKRIEVTNSEFKELLGISDKSPFNIFEAMEIRQEGHSFSGSYIVYEGVCIQTHISYGY